MIAAQFMEDLASVLNEEASTLTPQTELAALKGWDSMGILGVMALLESARGEPTDLAIIQACRTCQDLIDLVEPKKT